MLPGGVPITAAAKNLCALCPALPTKSLRVNFIRGLLTVELLDYVILAHGYAWLRSLTCFLVF